MPVKSSRTNYGTVAVTIHWLTALLILALFVLGFRAASMDDSADKLRILSMHVPLGWLVFLLTLACVGWWAFATRQFHGAGARIMLALLAAHNCAAMYYQFIKRDGILQRMWFRR